MAKYNDKEVILVGLKGEPGPQGPQGPKGDNGGIDKEQLGFKILAFFKDTKYTTGAFLDQNGNPSNSFWAYSDYIEIESNKTYWLNYAYQCSGVYYDENKNFVASFWFYDVSSIERKKVFTTPDNVKYIRINTKEEYIDVQCIGYGSSSLTDEEIANYNERAHMPYINTSQWVGKTFVTFGDSITWQDGREYIQGENIGTIAKGYQTHLKNILGFNSYTNMGVSGVPIANGSSNGDGTNTTVKTFDFTSYDLCIIAGGTNDFKLNIPLGNIGVIGDASFDTETFYGALRDTIEHVLKQKPTIRLCLFTPLQRNNGNYDVNTMNSSGHKLIDYVEAIKEVGRMYAVPVCDMYANSSITQLTLSTYTMDGLHPNNKGYVRMGGYAAKFIDNIAL